MLSSPDVVSVCSSIPEECTRRDGYDPVGLIHSQHFCTYHIDRSFPLAQKHHDERMDPPRPSGVPGCHGDNRIGVLSPHNGKEGILEVFAIILVRR